VNIILTCAGRRNYLVKYFQAALAGTGKVIATDASKNAVALQDADVALALPFVNDPSYLEQLLAICQEYQPRLLISLNDLELPLLARERHRFLAIGTIPVVSKPVLIDTCFDKWATNTFLNTCEILTPQTYLTLSDAQQAIFDQKLNLPVVIKPRWGSGSVGIAEAGDPEELEIAYKYVKKLIDKTFLSKISATDSERCVMIQQKVIGQEYGLDIINDLQGNYVTTVIKKKLAMRSGETDRAITVTEDRLLALGEKIGRRTKHIGNLDCDAIIDEQDIYVIDMNPRFGGGYPFSHVAGIDLPAALIAWAAKTDINPHWLQYTPGIMSSKYDQLITH
jgi:carbamoyl-phosphate synthase large subunit